jgi:hypothetical protein
LEWQWQFLIAIRLLNSKLQMPPFAFVFCLLSISFMVPI